MKMAIDCRHGDLRVRSEIVRFACEPVSFKILSTVECLKCNLVMEIEGPEIRIPIPIYNLRVSNESNLPVAQTDDAGSRHPHLPAT